MTQADSFLSPRGAFRPAARRPPPLVSSKHAPSIAECVVRFPDQKYDQKALTASLEQKFADRPHALAHLRRLHENVGVSHRHLALPLDEYATLDDFGMANDAYIRVATDLASAAISAAVANLGLVVREVDAIFFTTVTGVSAPSIDARVVNRLGLRSDIKRTPMFGLGCLGGAAGLARTSDYLRAYPNHVAVLLAVELCSLTLQNDLSIAGMIASGLFADAAAAAVLVGSERALHLARPRPQRRARVIDTRSAFFHDTERIMGWDIGSAGFKVVLSADVPTIAKERLPAEVDRFLEAHKLERRDIDHWVCHPGGPKVISAIEEAFDLPPAALRHTRESLASVGNLSSVSVLDVFARTGVTAEPGDLGMLIAMGPGFCAELLLLEWQ